MLIVACLSLLIAFGEKAGLYLFLPLRQLILPERFLNVTVVILPLLIASSPVMRIVKWWLIVGLVLILLVDFAPIWRIIHMRPAPDDLVHLAQVSSSRPFTGRSVPIINPSPSSQHIYFTSVEANRYSATGWALENTPQHQGIRRLGQAMNRSLDYLPAILSLWNTDYIITERHTQVESLKPLYRPIVADGLFKLWERVEPSSFAHALPDNPMLIVGDNPTSWVFAFPFASEGYSPELADYTPEYLARFRAIGLNRIPNPNGIEPILREWVEDGGTLIMDLSNLPAPHHAGFQIFGVQTFSYLITMNNPIQSDILGFPDLFTLPAGIDQWVGNTYYDLDEVLLSINIEGEIYPMLGYKDVGQGRVWFIGFNLFYWLDLQHDPSITQNLVKMILADTDVYQDLTLPALNIHQKQYHHATLTLDYSLEQDQYVILSQTYFPRWQASIDGQPIEIENHQHLIALNLPSGQHQLKLIYEPYSIISLFSFGVSVFGLLLLVGVLIFLRIQEVLTVQDRIHDFFDRHSYGHPPTEQETELLICSECGQQTAIAFPPTQETYPFFVIKCSQCGFHTSDTSNKKFDENIFQ